MRKVMRVPLDFDHSGIWPGYLRPSLPECDACSGAGSTYARQWLEPLVSLILMLDSGHFNRPDRQGELHPYLYSLPNAYRVGRGTEPGPDIVALTTGLAGREPFFGLHDAIDQWAATNKIIAAAGLDPDTWGHCPKCDGDGLLGTAEEKAARDAWEPTEPPTGEGWQLWETTTEGSPISPVFASSDELVDWIVDHEGYRRSAAEQLLADGGATMTLIGTSDGRLLDAAKDADLIAQIEGRR